jgi:putative ABC transport system permease protein
MGIKIAAGRNFSSLSGNDDSDTILINEESARRFGWDNPVGKTIRNLSDNKTKKIIGVVRDFHLRSLHYGISPLYIDYVPSRFRFISIKLIPGDISKTLAFLNKKWQEIDPEHTFEYFFLDKTFDSQYKAEDRLIRIFSYFTFLAIFIGCSGLFGLSSYTSEQRTKEIGIRKALGASISGITLLLSKEFTKWVLMANLIAWPLAYLAMNRWLQNFAYRINIGLGTFVLSALLAFIIALLTIGYQAVKAARANPVDALRYE